MDERAIKGQKMEVIQKKGKNKHTFRLGQEQFEYAYEDGSAKGDVEVYYGDLPLKRSEQTEQNDWLRNVGVLWILLGLFQSGYGSFTRGAFYFDPMWIFIGAACLTWALMTKVTYTVFKAEGANIFIIKDKHHDALIEELMARRKAQLANWYADINPENELNNEINKFKWLVKQEVLTEEESEQKIKEVKFYHQVDDEQRVLN